MITLTETHRDTMKSAIRRLRKANIIEVTASEFDGLQNYIGKPLYVVSNTKDKLVSQNEMFHIGLTVTYADPNIFIEYFPRTKDFAVTQLSTGRMTTLKANIY